MSQLMVYIAVALGAALIGGFVGFFFAVFLVERAWLDAFRR